MSIKDTKGYIALEERALQATVALYRVTDLYSDNEPIKWMLRKDAIEFAHYISNYVMASEADVLSEDLQLAHDTCKMLRRKFMVLKIGGYISKMNVEVLEKEYMDLSDIITEFIKDMSYSIHKDIKDIPIRQEFNNDAPVKAENIGKKNSREPSSTNERQEAIKEILRGREWLSAMEVASLFGAGFSVKTVQRDLNTLLGKGVIRGKGERRWRKYSLVKH
jgi:hypothetical protein